MFEDAFLTVLCSQSHCFLNKLFLCGAVAGITRFQGHTFYLALRSWLRGWLISVRDHFQPVAAVSRS
jgi:hypothetical protein